MCKPIPIPPATNETTAHVYPFKMIAAVDATNVDAYGRCGFGGVTNLWHECRVQGHDDPADWAEVLWHEHDESPTYSATPGVYYFEGTIEVVVFSRERGGGFESYMHSLSIVRMATASELVAIGAIEKG